MTKLTFTESEFRRLIAPVQPFVARESAVHVLEGVRIRTEPGRVVAEAVSATMLGMCVRPYDDAPEGFDIVFPIDDLPTVYDTVETIELEQTSRATVVVAWSRRSALAEYDTLDPSRFPDLRKKIAAALEVPTRTVSVWLDAHQLSAFRAAADLTNNQLSAPIVFHPGTSHHDMILVTCGTHFAGMASPASPHPKQPTRTKYRVQPPPAGDPIELWRTLLATPEGE